MVIRSGLHLVGLLILSVSAAGGADTVTRVSANVTAAVSDLLALPVNRERIGAAGRRLYEEQYTWASAWKVLAALLDE